MRYDIVKGDSPEILVEKMGFATKAGWEPYGSPFVATWAPGHGFVSRLPDGDPGGFIFNCYCQAVTKDVDTGSALSDD